MNLKEQSPKLTVRRWRESDAVFVCYLRNSPRLMKWFRQTKPITVEDEKNFIRNDKDYNGQIVKLDNSIIGVLAIRNSGELCVVMEAENYKYLPYLLKDKQAWGEVFHGNPIQKYLKLAGFKKQGKGKVYNGRPTTLWLKS